MWYNSASETAFLAGSRAQTLTHIGGALMDIVRHKVCPVCKESKPTSTDHFYRSSSNRDGFQSRCKGCKDSKANAREKLPEGLRRCRVCKEVKSLDEFSQRSASGAKHYYCKPCRRVWHEQHLEDQREKARLRARAIRLADPEKARLRDREYRAANAERKREQERRRRLANPEPKREQDRRYYLGNKQVFKHNAALRRARKKGAEGHYTEAEFKAKLEQHKGCCHWCHKKIVGIVHRDHLIALSNGGSNDIGNIVPSCAPCNLSKHTRMPWEFMEGRLL